MLNYICNLLHNHTIAPKKQQEWIYQPTVSFYNLRQLSCLLEFRAIVLSVSFENRRCEFTPVDSLEFVAWTLFP